MKRQSTIKKYFSIIITFILFLSMTLPVTTQAATPNPASDFDYKEAGGKITITKYKGTSTDVVIPATINSKSVTVIDENAFNSYNTGIQLTSVEIPTSVTTIGNAAFYEIQLTSVEIPASVTRGH